MTMVWKCIDEDSGETIPDVVKVDGEAMLLERYLRDDAGQLVADDSAGLRTETVPLSACVFSFAPDYTIVVRMTRG